LPIIELNPSKKYAQDYISEDILSVASSGITTLKNSGFQLKNQQLALPGQDEDTSSEEMEVLDPPPKPIPTYSYEI